MPDSTQGENADKDAQRRFILSEEEMEVVETGAPQLKGLSKGAS